MGIGPSSKETTLHHYRDPLVEILSMDTELSFLGIAVQGTPEVYAHKKFVAERAGALAEMAQADGVIVSIDSWGNSHVDFSSVIESIGERGIPVVGLSFVGNQARFVVTNRYMDAIVDINKTTSGIETTMVGQNTVTEADARKAAAILKNRMRKHKGGPPSCEITERRLRRLLVCTFPVNHVGLSDEDKLRGTRISLDGSRTAQVAEKISEVEELSVRVLAPGKLDVWTNSILDVSPLAAKVEGRPGEGVSCEAAGVQVLLSAVEQGGFQPANIGSSEGTLRDKLCLDRRGTPSSNDYIIQVDAVLAQGQGRTRSGIMAAHRACDQLIEPLRQELRRAAVQGLACSRREYWDIIRPGRYRVLLFKLVSGLGCMYDTSLFPTQPGGFSGSRSIMDISNNMPVIVSPNEYRDGVIHSLC